MSDRLKVIRISLANMLTITAYTALTKLSTNRNLCRVVFTFKVCLSHSRSFRFKKQGENLQRHSQRDSWTTENCGGFHAQEHY